MTGAGVGGKEIGYLFGQYKRTKRSFEGVLTGKDVLWGGKHAALLPSIKCRTPPGSHIRPEATGYGCVYFSNEALKSNSDGLEGKRCTISGSGNVAQYTCEKLLDLGMCL